MSSPSSGHREDVAISRSVPFQRSRSGDRALVLLHGFLDDRTVWDPVLSALAAPGFEIIQIDHAGMGARAKDSGPFSLERLADDALAVVDSLKKPVVIVGQSMGAQVAELVAAGRPELVDGLVLLTPVPLAGTHMPSEMAAQFKSAGDPNVPPGEARRGLMATISQDMIDRFSRSTALIDLPVMGQLVDAWDGGHEDGKLPSKYTGPVAILPGSGDWFISAEVVAAGVSPRFTKAAVEVVDKAGHWPHVEQPNQVAALLDTFLAERAHVAK